VSTVSIIGGPESEQHACGDDMAGSQDYQADPRNETVKVYLNGRLVPRNEAFVSIFDAGFSMGDGVWEGLRLHKGALMFLDAHLDRLFDGARRLSMDIGLDREGLKSALRPKMRASVRKRFNSRSLARPANPLGKANKTVPLSQRILALGKTPGMAADTR
jgi:hypothetical protein